MNETITVFRESVFLLIEKGHSNVYQYSLGWFYAMLETFASIQEQRLKAMKEDPPG